MGRGKRRGPSSGTPAPQSALDSFAVELGFIPEPPEPYVINLDAHGVTNRQTLVTELRSVLARHPGKRPAKLQTGGKRFSFAPALTVDGSNELYEEIKRLLNPTVLVSTIADARASRAKELREAPASPQNAVPPFTQPASRIAELSPTSLARLRDAASRLTETIDQAVMQALINAYPHRLTRIELWGSFFVYKSDPQSGEAFVRDDSTNPDKTIWWSLKYGDDWVEMPEGVMTPQRAGALLDHQPTSKFADALRGQERNFSPNYLRRTAIPRIESEISLPISSSNNQADPGFRLVIGKGEMMSAQESDRRGLRNREKRLDYLADSAGYFAGETDELPSPPEYEETPQATSHAEKRRTALREKRTKNTSKRRDDGDSFERTVFGS
jgi:hypothetical protein